MFVKTSAVMSKRKGFTLVELLVVVLIISFMGKVAYDMLGTAIQLESRTAEHANAIEQMTRVLSWLQQDAEQFVDRPIRDELGERLPSLIVQHGRLSLTHLGWANPLQVQRSNAQRVSYHFTNNELNRLSWQVLDRAQDSKSVTQKLSGQGKLDIEAIEFSVLSYTNGKSHWQTEWPPKSSFLPGDQHHAQAIALRVRLTSQQLGTIERVFELPSITIETNQ